MLEYKHMNICSYINMKENKNIKDSECEFFSSDPAHVKKAAAAVPEESVIETMAGIFQAAADPARLKILLALAETELCVCDISVFSGFSQSAVSHHLRVLRDRKIVKYRRAGKMALYSLEDEHVKDILCKCLAHVKEG